jgi:hypothetical protein
MEKALFSESSMDSFRMCGITLKKVVKVKGETIPVTDHESLWGCEISTITYCLDKRVTDGGEVVKLTLQPRFTPERFPGAE